MLQYLITMVNSIDYYPLYMTKNLSCTEKSMPKLNVNVLFSLSLGTYNFLSHNYCFVFKQTGRCLSILRAYIFFKDSLMKSSSESIYPLIFGISLLLLGASLLWSPNAAAFNALPAAQSVDNTANGI